MVNVLETQPYFMNDQDHPRTGGVMIREPIMVNVLETQPYFMNYQDYLDMPIKK